MIAMPKKEYPICLWSHSEGLSIHQLDSSTFRLTGESFGVIGTFTTYSLALAYAIDEFLT